MSALRKGLPALPERVARLPIDHRGYPIPWFVAEIDGKRDFRVADGNKRVRAVRERLCWICGERLGAHLAFAIGPMSAVNRNTSEPPSHRDCAEFAAKACPFLILPAAQYRDAHLPSGITAPMHMLPGNPGAVCIWITKTFKPYRVADGAKSDWLIRIGDPVEVLWFCGGATATRDQIMKSFAERLHFLESQADQDGPEARELLAQMVACTMKLLPA